MEENLKKILTVSEVTRKIKTILEGGIGAVCVCGEISNWRPASTGHCYFTLKDANAQLAIVLFAGSRARLTFKPQNGMLVEVSGELTVYPQRGQYQVVARKITLAGAGDLMAQFEHLKTRLAAEGLFAQEHKKPLPILPRRIGIVTAPGGAAIRDIINILTRRFYNLDILIAPARVQGNGAAVEIAAGIVALNKVGREILPGRPTLDVIIVTRGGGSLEDLWQFNEEVVARAVFASEIPVISAVGHEIDFSICDFCADFRAPTPSAAAEIVVRSKADFEDMLSLDSKRMSVAMNNRLSHYANRLKIASGNRVFAEPSHAVSVYFQNIDILFNRLQNRLRTTLTELRRCTDDLASRLEVERARRIPELRTTVSRFEERVGRAFRDANERLRRRIELAAGRLGTLNPAAVLERGYSITLLDDGRALRSPDEVAEGTRLTTRLTAGKSVVSYVAAPVVTRDKKVLREKARRRSAQADAQMELGL